MRLHTQGCWGCEQPSPITLQLILAAKSPPLLGAPSCSSLSPPHPSISGEISPSLARDWVLHISAGGCLWGRKPPRRELGKQRPSRFPLGRAGKRGEAALLRLADPPPSSFSSVSKSACFSLSVCLTGEMDWKTQGRSKQLSPWGKLSAHNSLGLV